MSAVPLLWLTWLTLAVGIAVSVAALLLLRTYWGLAAYGPYLVAAGARIRRSRKNRGRP